MIGRDVVVIGASAGGIPALTTVLQGLPAGLHLAIFVVVHSSADNPGRLPDVLGKRARYPAAFANDGEPIRHGRVYVAPADRHMTIDDGRVVVTRGPRENRFRPAVDPLFRTAAESYGQRVIAVVLSGALGDGSHGLAMVKKRGGVAVVQDASDAAVPSMPLSALKAVAADHVVPSRAMPALIAQLAGAAPSKRRPLSKGRRSASAAPGGEGMEAPPSDGPPSGFTCPDCGGALWELEESGVLHYACHVGHRLSVESLLAGQVDGIEASLWSAVRALEETAEMRRRMATRARTGRMDALATQWEGQAEEAEVRADDLRRAIAAARPRPRAARRPKPASKRVR